jgi:NhaA family Na+:H+ antiporter
LGIALGLFLGKQFGVFGSSWLAVKLGIARLPQNTNWYWIYGVSLLCGIGFTMSLFIGGLAFSEVKATYAVVIRIGVLLGSILSGILGYFFLLITSKRVQNQ